MQSKSKAPLGILTKGWFKFLRSTRANIGSFIVNPGYAAQMEDPTLVAHLKDKDEFGSLLIPAKNMFYFVLTTDSIIILTSRADKMVKAQEVIDLNGLDTIRGPQEGLPMREWTGGLEYLGGNFTEGSCFKLKKVSSEYIICAEDSMAFGNILTYLVKILLQKYDPKKFPGDYLATADKPEESVDFSNPGDNFVDITGWSTCDKKCGGGSKQRVRACVPNKKNDCTTKPTKVDMKECNTRPCAEGEAPESEAKQADGTLVNPEPEIKVTGLQESMLFKRASDRQQRQKECELREGDMCIVKEEILGSFEKFGEIPKIPGWAVLNLRTFTIYESANNFTSVAGTFNLKDVRLQDWIKDPDNCFTALSGGKTNSKPFVLCACPFSTQNTAIVKTNWIMDIEHFRDDCQNTESSTAVSPDALNNSTNPTDMLLSAGVSKDDIVKLQAKHQRQQAEEAEEKQEEEVKKDLGCNVTETAKLAQTAMKKELKDEELREREEFLREKQELKGLEKKVAQQEEIENCIRAALKKKARAQGRKSAAIKVAQKIEEIKKETRDNIENTRKQTQKTLDSMQRETMRKKMELQKRLSYLRMEMTSELLKAETEGDMNNCRNDKSDYEIENYCNRVFNDNWPMNKVCRDRKNFCTTCCENEYGDLKQTKRDECLVFCEQSKNREETRAMLNDLKCMN